MLCFVREHLGFQDPKHKQWVSNNFFHITHSSQVSEEVFIKNYERYEIFIHLQADQVVWSWFLKCWQKTRDSWIRDKFSLANKWVSSLQQFFFIGKSHSVTQRGDIDGASAPAMGIQNGWGTLSTGNLNCMISSVSCVSHDTLKENYLSTV